LFMNLTRVNSRLESTLESITSFVVDSKARSGVRLFLLSMNSSRVLNVKYYNKFTESDFGVL
jgi:hypothetical protein